MPMNVLIMDDSTTMRKIVRKTLRQPGLELGDVHEAGDGYEGLHVIASQPIDVILSDINMPNMNGIEFLEKLSELKLQRPVAIVMITTEGTDDLVQGAMDRGAGGYVKKPFTPQDVQKAIGAAVRKARAAS